MEGRMKGSGGGENEELRLVLSFQLGAESYKGVKV